MSLINIDTELDRQGVSRIVSSTDATTVTETVKVHQRPVQSSTYLDRQEWGWEELRDYVVAQITERHGPFPRDSRKEAGIFKRFVSEWGSQAKDIAKFAFEVEGGFWAGAPISIFRFCKNSDPYFAAPIVERIHDAARRG